MKTAGVVLASALGVVCVSACAHFGPNFKQDELNCGRAALADASARLGPDVIKALSSVAVDWRAELEALVITDGVDVVTCAVAVAVRDYEATKAQPARPIMGAACPVPQSPLLEVRGHSYLDDKKIPVLPILK